MVLFLNGGCAEQKICSAGFTLLELMVVMVIMTVFLSLTVPRLMPQLMSSRIKASYSDISSMVNLARIRAVEARYHQLLIFDLDRNMIQLKEKGSREVFIQKRFPKGMTCAWVRVNGVKTQNGQVGIVFQPDGTTAHTRIKVKSENSEAVLFEISGSGSRVRIRQ